jgi:cytochrome c biogenesis protein CcmG/thiol:disulfide interchange protein DsbE
MVYLGARLSRKSVQAGGTASPAEEESSSTPKAGSMAPDFELKTADGKIVKLSDYRGKAVLLNFWATWCGPCKIETPWLVDFYKQYQPQGLEIVGVAMDDAGSQDEIAKFVKDMNINYTIVQGTEKVADAYGGIDGLPISFFIDRNGKIVNMTIGLRGQRDLEDDIKKIVTASPQAVAAGNHVAQ